MRSKPFRNSAGSLALVALLAPLAACEGDSADVDVGVAGLRDGQPEAVGVLAFLNHEDTTFELLDEQVPLDRRAAENIITHRNGPDGVYGTDDDRPFTSIDEVVDVYWVGPASLQRILDYAAAHGWIPEGDEVLGVYDGVVFTVDDAERTLNIANSAPDSVLRQNVGLQARTVASLIDNRPYASILELSETRYVGPASLERLRNYAAEAAPPLVCTEDAECPSGARCHGIDQGQDGAGICRHDDELLGIFDGVAFTIGQADASLVLANYADAELLRAQVGLSARAVDNLIADRPIDDLEALAAVAWIGPASLERIRDFAQAHPEIIAALRGDGRWRALSSGGSHSCGIADDGSLWCWGGNEHGQLGVGDTDHRDRPARVGSQSDWIQVSAGRTHSCGIREGGSLWCWGQSRGRLGLGDDGFTESRHSPTRVGEQTGWEWVSGGAVHSCGIRDGAAYCWGRNREGQLGLGHTHDQTSPRAVDSEVEFVEIAAGDVHSCGIGADGSLWCWGENRRGAVASGHFTSSRTSPYRSGTATDWVTVSLGEERGCGLRDRSDGKRLYCWGNNEDGALGFGDNDDRAGPREREGLWSALAMGHRHGCGIAEDGSLWCWGDGGDGRLGTGGTTRAWRAEQAGSKTDWVALTAGDRHGCGLRDGGTLWCWGDNEHGRLGTGLGGPYAEPVELATEQRFGAVTSHGTHGCGIGDDGTLWCWGAGYSSGAGRDDQKTPVQVGEHADWIAVDSGTHHSCGIRESGRLYCWGRNDDAQLGLGHAVNRDAPELVGYAVDWIAVAAGGRHTCGIRESGRLYCWGWDAGAARHHGEPVPKSYDDDWDAISAGTAHTCALRSDDSLWCWGQNTYGQLGLGDRTTRYGPHEVAPEGGWTAMSAGSHHSCALRDEGELWCWGYNHWGMLGVGDTERRLSPERVGEERDWVAVSPGGNHTCGLRDGGELWCWGRGESGQTGLGDLEDRHSPARAAVSGVVVDVAAATWHTHALDAAGRVVSFGRNRSGRLGDGTAFTSSPVFVSRQGDAASP